MPELIVDRISGLRDGRMVLPADATRAPEIELTLASFLAALRRRWLVLVGCLVLAVVAAAAYILLIPPVYEATSVVRFEQEQVNLPLLVQQLSTENRISTEIEVLQGRGVAKAVIDSLGLRAEVIAPRKAQATRLFTLLRVSPAADTGTLLVRIESDTGYSAWRSEAPDQRVLARLGEAVQIGGVTLAVARGAAAHDVRLRIVSLDDAIRRFESMLKVSRPARDADLIDIKFRAGDPQVAARGANLLAQHLIAMREAARHERTGTAIVFLREQVDSLRGQLRVAEDKLRAYRESARAVDPVEQSRTQVGRLSQIEADRAGLEAEQQALAALLATVRAEPPESTTDGPSPYRRLIAFPTLFRNQATAELLNSLAHAENERATLLLHRTWQDSDVQLLTARIAELDRQLRTMAETYLQGLTNQVAALSQIGRSFGKQLDSLPAKEVNTARLERETRVLQDMYSLVQTRLKEAEITQAMADPTLRIVDAAAAPDRPLRPRPVLNLIVALLLGSVLGVTISLNREHNDQSVRSRADALYAAGLPVLGAIPRVEGRLPRSHRRLSGHRRRHSISPIVAGRSNGAAGLPSPAATRTAAAISARLVTDPKTSSVFTESFNQLYANLALAFQDRPIKVLVFTSPLPGDGKSLSAINFALTAAARGHKVLLIDADLRCGLVNQVFGRSRRPGLSELLDGTARFEEAARTITVSEGVSLTLLPTGALLRGPSVGLAMDHIRVALKAFAQHYDMVVIDSPPVNVLADAALLGSVADGVLLVVRAGRTRREALSFAMDRLNEARVPVIGTLLNDIDLRRNVYDDGAYRYFAEVEKYHAARSQ